MASYHVGQRLSYKSLLCTVRYIGPVEGTDKEWLGIEWDDPKRGKHNGEREGKRYFECLSNSQTAASFITIKSSRPDPTQSFIDAVRSKYATNEANPSSAAPGHQITVISGKTVEEVGFEKIQREQSQLNKLKIVLVDGLRVNKATSDSAIKDVCPKIVDLDLSRNLFESCREVIEICRELDYLRSLRLNGNRFKVTPGDLTYASQSFKSINTLSLDEVLLSWDDICVLASKFESLNHLTASSNAFTSLNSSFTSQLQKNLTSLTLEYNDFTSLNDLLPLKVLTNLHSIHLKGNEISSMQLIRAGESFSSSLHYVDLSYNKISSWGFVDSLADVFPGLTSLRFSHNPIYDILAKESGSVSSIDDGYMFTLARIGNLKTLNFSNISIEERRNAEMFYLSRIGQAIASVPESEELTVVSRHKRYAELCEVYGAPAVVRKSAEAINPDFLEARLIKFTFYLPPNSIPGQDEAITKEQEVPKGFDIYRVKGIVGRVFDLQPLSLKLVWETGEWDPVAGYEEQGEDEDSDDEEEAHAHSKISTLDDNGKWMKREVEIEDGTRQIGFCVDGMEARVRIELR